MRIRAMVSIFTVVVLAACGSDTDQVYQLTGGTYAVSGATTTSERPTDECGLLGAYQDPSKEIGITISGTTVTFNLANNPNAPTNSLPTATLNGNAIDTPVAANYVDGPYGTDCLLRINRTVTGELTGNDDTALTLNFEVTYESGTCTGVTIPVTSVPCQSGYHFLAKKQ